MWHLICAASSGSHCRFESSEILKRECTSKWIKKHTSLNRRTVRSIVGKSEKIGEIGRIVQSEKPTLWKYVYFSPSQSSHRSQLYTRSRTYDLPVLGEWCELSHETRIRSTRCKQRLQTFTLRSKKVTALSPVLDETEMIQAKEPALKGPEA